MTDRDSHLIQLAERQHSVFSRAQAEQLGFTAGAIQRRRRARRWTDVHSGIYRLPGSRLEHLGQLWAGVLAVPGAIVSHESAAWLHHFPGVAFRPVLTTDPDGSHTCSLARVHRYGGLHGSDAVSADDIVEIEGLPVTSPALTLFHLSTVMPRRKFERLLDDRLNARAVGLDELDALADYWTRRGRPNRQVMRRLLTARGPGYIAPMSVLESAYLELVDSAGLPAPVRQFPVRRPDGRWAYIDLAYPSKLAAIETDGWRWHGGRTSFDADRLRSNDLLRLGWSCIHFTSVMPDEHLITTLTSALGLTSGEDPRR